MGVDGRRYTEPLQVGDTETQSRRQVGSMNNSIRRISVNVENVVRPWFAFITLQKMGNIYNPYRPLD